MQKEFLQMVKDDILRIDQALQTNLPDENWILFRELDGRYQSCIKNWYCGMWEATTDGTKLFFPQLKNRPEYVLDNLRFIKSKLETFQYEMNAITMPELPSTQVNVTTNVNVTISFDEVRKKIEDNGSLSKEQTDEAIEKINELEAISKENISRKSKWEKIKPIIAFAMDKGADLGIAILSLIVQMRLGM